MAVTVVTEVSDRLPEGLRTEISHRGRTAMVELAGELDLAAATSLRDALREAFRAHPEFAVLDLSRLTFIDATGVRAVAQAGFLAAADRVHLAIIPGPPAVQRVFTLCGLATPGQAGQAGSAGGHAAVPVT